MAEDAIKDMLDGLKADLKALNDKKTDALEDIQKEVKEKGKTIKDVQDEVNKFEEKMVEIEDKITALEEKAVEMGRMPNGEKQDEKRDFGFKSIGEFVSAAISNSKDNPADERLKELGDFMKKELATDPGTAGGFVIPERFGEMLPMFQPQNAIFRPRATVIAAGDPPEGKISFPALDQSGAKGVYAGVQTEWIEEGGTKPETDYEYREISLEPHEVAGRIHVTDKMLRNAPGVAGTINQMLSWALAKSEDDAFMTGNGVGKPTGLLGHASTIEQTRATADQINYEDVVKIYSQMLFGGNYTWLISQTDLPQLMQMKDASGNLIWQPNAVEGSPGSLLGVPTTLNERQPTLGTTGDIGLVDLMYYYIKDGVGPMIASSEHVEFVNNKTVVKAFKSVDGKPAITSPLQLENGEEVSPFVFLSSEVTV